MRKILKRLGMLMLISVSCMSQSVQIPLHAQTMLAAPATREEVKISPTDVIRKGFKVRVETPKGLHDDYENKWVIKMSEKSSSGYDSCVYSKIWIDDQRVYCVDPLTSVMNGAQDYEQISFGAYVNDAAVREKLSYITALGYGFQGDTSMRWILLHRSASGRPCTNGNPDSIRPSVISIKISRARSL